MKFIVGIVVRFYLVWSMLYRWLLEPPEKTDVKAYDTLEDLEKVLKKAKWVKDGIRQFGDAIGSPEHFQWLLDNDKVPKSGRDCDEFAVYAYKVLTTHPIRDVEVVGCMSVVWHKDERGGCGHNVCVLKMDGNYAHIGNWGLYSGFHTLKSCIGSVLKNRKLRGWGLWEYPWGLIRCGAYLPND